MSSAHRRWCGTWNLSPEVAAEAELLPGTNCWVPDFDRDKISYFVGQLERGESGNVHLQCYFELRRENRSIPAIKNILKCDGIHLESARGSYEDNLRYCTKESTRIAGCEPFLHGTPKKRGRHTMDDAHESASNVSSADSDGGKKLKDMVSLVLDGNTFDTLVRDERFKALAFIHKKKIDEVQLSVESRDYGRTVYSEVRWSTLPGTGKTSSCFRRQALEHGIPERFPDLQSWKDENIYFRMGITKWWCGYKGEPVVVIDDLNFTGDAEYKAEQLLGILEGYQSHYEVKGGHVKPRWKHVVITSNIKPDEWFLNTSVPITMQQAILDRIKKVTDFAGPQFRATTVVAPFIEDE